MENFIDQIKSLKNVIAVKPFRTKSTYKIVVSADRDDWYSNVLIPFLTSNGFSFERKFIRSLSTTADTFIINLPDGTAVKIVAKPSTSLAASKTASDESFQAKLLNYYLKTGELPDFSEFGIPKEFENDSSWIHTFRERTLKLASEFPNRDLTYVKSDDKKSEAGKVVQKIYKKFKELNRKEKIFGNVNKWNPADIWGIDLKRISQYLEKIESANSFTELNRILKDALFDNVIIPVSLKKVGKTANIEYYNVEGPIPAPNLNVKIIDRPTANSIVLSGDLGNIQFRNFSTFGGWEGEILGRHARGGKVSGNIIFKILKNLGVHVDQDLISKVKKDFNDIRAKRGNWDKKFSKYADFLKKRGIKREFDSKKISDLNWMMSKFLSGYLADILKSHKNILDDFYQKIFDYAASKSELSAPFVKIY